MFVTHLLHVCIGAMAVHLWTIVMPLIKMSYGNTRGKTPKMVVKLSNKPFLRLLTWHSLMGCTHHHRHQHCRWFSHQGPGRSVHATYRLTFDTQMWWTKFEDPFFHQGTNYIQIWFLNICLQDMGVVLVRDNMALSFTCRYLKEQVRLGGPHPHPHPTGTTRTLHTHTGVILEIPIDTKTTPRIQDLYNQTWSTTLRFLIPLTHPHPLRQL